MGNILNRLLPVLLIIYIISPFDAHPLFFDDLIAAGFLIYTLYRNSSAGAKQGGSRNEPGNEGEPQPGMSLDLNESYRILGIGPDSSWEDISKAYKEKMARSHPDKVNHLSEELQEKAKEITLKLNRAYEMIKKSKGK
jgi:DnaJ-class molecular chaperone